MGEMTNYNVKKMAGADQAELTRPAGELSVSLVTGGKPVPRQLSVN